MSNLRAPANIFFSTLLQKAHYSSGSGEKASQELLKQVQHVVEDKVKAEKLKHLLPFLQHGNPQFIPRTNIIDTQTEVGKESDQVKVNITEPPEKYAPAEACNVKLEPCDIFESSKVSSESSATPPLSLPALVVAQVKTPTMDLTNAMLPLSLHIKDKKSFLVDAVVQDLKHVYFKTSSAIDGWCLVAKTQGKTLYLSAEEIMKRPGPVQDFLRERANMNAISVYDPKLAAIANIDVSSIIEKIKQLIENIAASIKKIFQKETKPAGSEEKKKEEKSEKVEKTEKKVEVPVEKSKTPTV